MALEPLFSRQIYDMTIVPVGVAYERPLEEQLFAYELLGVPKPKESTKVRILRVNLSTSLTITYFTGFVQRSRSFGNKSWKYLHKFRNTNVGSRIPFEQIKNDISFWFS